MIAWSFHLPTFLPFVSAMSKRSLDESASTDAASSRNGLSVALSAKLAKKDASKQPSAIELAQAFGDF